MKALAAARAAPATAQAAVVAGVCVGYGVLAGVNPALAVGGALGAAFVVVVFSDLVLGIAIYATLSFLQVLTTTGAGASLDKLTGLLLVASWWAVMTTRPHASLRGLIAQHPAMLAFLTLFAAWTLLSTVWADRPAEALSIAYRDGLEFLVVPIVYSAVRDWQDLRRIVAGYLIGAAVSVLYGFFLPHPDTAVARDDVGRLVGSLGESNQAATVLVAALGLSCGLLITAQRSPRTRALVAISGGLSAVGLVLTLSRGGLVAAAAMVVSAAFVGGPWRGRAAAVGVACLIGVVAWFALLAPSPAVQHVTSTESSGRNDVWRVGWRMFEANPVLGVGAGNFSHVSARYLQRPGLITAAPDFLVAPKVAHNIYLEQLSELGVPGLVLLLGIIATGLSAFLRAARAFARRHEREAELLARSACVALIGFLTAEFFVSGLLYKQLWLVFALGPAMLKLAEPQERRLPNAT